MGSSPGASIPPVAPAALLPAPLICLRDPAGIIKRMSGVQANTPGAPEPQRGARLPGQLIAMLACACDAALHMHRTRLRCRVPVGQVHEISVGRQIEQQQQQQQQQQPLLERTWCRLRSVRDRPCLIRRCSYLLVFGTAVQCRTWSARGHRLVQLTACVVPIDIWHGFQCRTWSARDHRLVQLTAYVVPIDIWHAAPCQMPCGTADDPHARVPNVVIGTTDVW